MHEFEAILKVLGVGLVLGAGLPALFAVGLRWFVTGSGDSTAQGGAAPSTAANPALRTAGIVLFGVIGAIIVVAILWITRTTINYHFGVNLFPFAPVK